MPISELSAVAGVLLWNPDSLPAAELTPAQDTLLLGWLAAQKLASGTLAARLTGVLARLGWATTLDDSTQAPLTLARLSDDLFAAMAPDDAPRLAAAVRAGSREVLDAWWKYAGAQPAGPTLVLACARADSVLELAVASVPLCADGRVYLDTPATIPASLQRTRLALNANIYAGVADDIAGKVAPHRNLIVS